MSEIDKAEQTCQCLTWARVPECEHRPLSFTPISNHHPRCPSFKLEEFACIEYCGSKMIVQKDTVADVLENDFSDPDDQPTITAVMLTRDQYENLPEHMGW